MGQLISIVKRLRNGRFERYPSVSAKGSDEGLTLETLTSYFSLGANLALNAGSRIKGQKQIKAGKRYTRSVVCDAVFAHVYGTQ